MEAYYPIFVLLLSLCEAPAGKTVCEKATLTFRFANALDCWIARADLINYYDTWPNVIIDRAATTCELEIAEAWDSDREALRKRAEQELRDTNVVAEP